MEKCENTLQQSTDVGKYKIDQFEEIGGEEIEGTMQIRCREDCLQASCFGPGEADEVDDYFRRPFSNMGTDMPYSFHARRLVLLCWNNGSLKIAEVTGRTYCIYYLFRNYLLKPLIQKHYFIVLEKEW